MAATDAQWAVKTSATEEESSSFSDTPRIGIPLSPTPGQIEGDIAHARTAPSSSCRASGGIVVSHVKEVAQHQRRWRSGVRLPNGRLVRLAEGKKDLYVDLAEGLHFANEQCCGGARLLNSGLVRLAER